MTFDYALGAVVVAGLLVYLVYALIRGLMRHDLSVRRIHTRF